MCQALSNASTSSDSRKLALRHFEVAADRFQILVHLRAYQELNLFEAQLLGVRFLSDHMIQKRRVSTVVTLAECLVSNEVVKFHG